MLVLTVRNAHAALTKALYVIDHQSIEQSSRNGPVLRTTEPVTTVYTNPEERVVFWPQRDANPFFHLYEALWMLAGRNDVASLTRYAKKMADFSDDGRTLWGAYGKRWRAHFLLPTQYGSGVRHHHDQLTEIAKILSKNPDDRRCVLQMWDPRSDLGRQGKDVPCNISATFQMDIAGRLEMTVFCRSNDIIWGAYGANAVHFAFLQEYLARKIGCSTGIFNQISVNWHAYQDVYSSLKDLPRQSYENPYDGTHLNRKIHPREIRVVPMPSSGNDEAIDILLRGADSGHSHADAYGLSSEWGQMIATMFRAHQVWRTREAPSRFTESLKILAEVDGNIDWIQAGREWIERRFQRWDENQSSRAYSESARRAAHKEI